MSIFFFKNQFINLFHDMMKEVFDYEGRLDDLHFLLDSDKLTSEDKIYHSELQQIGINDRDSVFIKEYHKYFDSNDAFKKEYLNFIENNVRGLFPGEEKLVVQKTPNLRISFPNMTAIGFNGTNKETVVGLHCDADFGHHYEEMNFIVPITKMYQTNSIYYEPFVGCGLDYDDYFNVVLNENELFFVKFNKLLHYNKRNETEKTRISLDFRVIPYSKYMQDITFFENTKFDLKNNYFFVI